MRQKRSTGGFDLAYVVEHPGNAAGREVVMVIILLPLGFFFDVKIHFFNEEACCLRIDVKHMVIRMFHLIMFRLCNLQKRKGRNKHR